MREAPRANTYRDAWAGDLTAAPSYGASKGGVNALTKSMARELGPDGIRVNAVAPHAIATEMSADWPSERRREIERSIPLGRLGTPDEVARMQAVVREAMEGGAMGVATTFAIVGTACLEAWERAGPGGYRRLLEDLVGDVARRELEETLGADAVLSDPLALRLYARDASMVEGSAGLVVFPTSTDHVVACVRTAAAHDLSVVPRGSGTGLTGASTPIGDALVVVTSKMDRILEIRPADRLAWVEPRRPVISSSRAPSKTGVAK